MKYRIHLIAVLVSAAAAGAASATVISGTSRTFSFQEVETDFTQNPPEVFDDGPENELLGTAPAPYSLSGFDAIVSSDVDGGAGVRFARAGFDDPDFFFETDLNISPPGESLSFQLSIDGLQQSAEVTGEFGSLVATGSTTFGAISATLNGNPLVVPLNPAPNTVLVDEVVGDLTLTVILNQQTVTGDGVTGRGIDVTAFTLEQVGRDAGGDLAFTSVRSNVFASAALTAVPEPTSLALLGAGGLLLARRRRG